MEGISNDVCSANVVYGKNNSRIRLWVARKRGQRHLKISAISLLTGGKRTTVTIVTIERKRRELFCLAKEVKVEAERSTDLSTDDSPFFKFTPSLIFR